MPGPPAPGLALGVFTVFMTLAGWSGVPLFITHLAKSIDVWTSNGWRYVISSLLWAPVLMVAAASMHGRERMKGVWRKALYPSLFNATGQAAFAWSFYNIDPATATFGLRMQLVFVSIGAYLMFPSERSFLRKPSALLGMLLVLIGIAGTLFSADRGNLPEVIGDPAKASFGILLSIIAGLLFAAYGLSVRKHMTGYHPVIAFAAISQYTSALLVGLMFVMAHDPVSGTRDFGLSVFQLSPEDMGYLAVSSVVGIALGHVFYYISLARLGVAVTSGVIQLQPFCVAIGQAVLFDKLITRWQWGFGFLAVVGALLLLGTQWIMTRRR
jgi:drug/metabolite transporter (DMT)-like permease